MTPINYEPQKLGYPKLLTDKPSAWGGIPMILVDIIERFNIDPKVALEFGVEWGYSSTALANYFEKVIGIDTFKGDQHAGFTHDHFTETSQRLSVYPNIQLVQSTYQDYIRNCDQSTKYDLIHVDIVHTYEDTYACGDWSVNHSKVTLFHDTELFQDVRRACEDLTIKYNLEFHNYIYSNGLGILINNNI